MSRSSLMSAGSLALIVLLTHAERRVATLVDGVVPPGRHRAVWGGNDAGGGKVAAGVYFVHLRSDLYRATTRVVLVQ
jgi:hypothetical protein